MRRFKPKVACYMETTFRLQLQFEQTTSSHVEDHPQIGMASRM